MPADRLLTAALLLAQVLVVIPGPETETDVALLVLQETVAEPGAEAVEGLTEIEPSTLGWEAAETVKVAVCVMGPPLPCAVRV